MSSSNNKQIEKHEVEIAVLKQGFIELKGVVAELKDTMVDIKEFMAKTIEMNYRLDGTIDQLTRINGSVNKNSESIEKLKIVAEQHDRKIWKFGFFFSFAGTVLGVIISTLIAQLIKHFI